MLEYLLLMGFILFIIVLIFLTFVSNKKCIMEMFPNKNVKTLRQKLIQLFLNKKWNVEIKKTYIHIEKGSFTAVNLYFKQNDKNVEIYYVSSTTINGWMLMIIGAFLFMVMTTVVAFFTDRNSRHFARREILPILIKIKEKGFKNID